MQRFFHFTALARCHTLALGLILPSLLCAASTSPETTGSTKVRTRQTTASAEKITTAALASGKIEGVQFRPDIPYLSPDRTEKLDLYLPASRPSGSRSPVIVMIHGGGWVAGSKDARRETQAGAAFARAGYVAVSVEYFKKGQKAWPTNIQDCKNAVRWVRDNAEKLQIDPDRIGVMGGSAGGHLALMVAYTGDHPLFQHASRYPGVSDRVSACLNLYGVSNLLTRQGTDETGKPNGDLRTRTALFPESREEAPEKWKLASPVTHITTSSPPTLIIHGAADTTVDRDQSNELAARLKQEGVPHQLLTIAGVGHAFPLADPRLPNDLRPVAIEFFDKHLKGTE